MKTARLSELVENRKSSYGNELGEDDADAFVVKVSNVSGAGQFHGEFERRSFSKEELAQLTVRPGDLCVVKSSGSKTNVLSGKTALVTSDTNSPLVASNFCFCLRPNVSLVEPRYLWRVLNSPASKSFIATIVSAFTYPNLKWSTYSNHPIPLPPLPEQKRIATILDAADALRAKQRESIEQLDSLIQATFLEMFGDPVTNPKGWETATLAEATSCLDKMRRPIKEEDRCPGDVPYYGANGQQGWIDAHIFNEPLVLVAEDGGHFDEPERGVAYRIDGPAWVNNHAHVLRPLPCVAIEYLHRCLRHYDFSPYISGTTRAKLNQKQMNRARLLIPPLSLQNRFASIVESIEQQKARLKSHLAELDTLFASLQSRAFNGELVA